MKYLVCTRQVPQRVRAGIWFTAEGAEYELTDAQFAAVKADEYLVVKPAAPAAPPARKAEQPAKK